MPSVPYRHLWKLRPGKLVAGLTGGLACGKTEVLNRLGKLGAGVISADSLARKVLDTGTPVYRAVAAKYGRACLGPGGEIDRTKLAGRVFSDPAQRLWLENAVHPWVLKNIAAFVRAGVAGVIVADIPLLFEKRLEGLFDITVCVYSTRRQQIRRAMKRGWKKEDVLGRIRAQLSSSEKAAMADVVLDNTGKIGDLHRQADNLYAALKIIA